MKERKRVPDILEWFFLITGFVVVAITSILVYTYKFDAGSSWPMVANALLGIVFFLLVFGLGLLIDRLLKKAGNRVKTVLCAAIQIVAVATIVILGTAYVSQTRIMLNSDAYSCYAIALRFLTGDYTAVVPVDSYLSLWPFQCSFICILQSIMKVFHSTDPLLFQKINVFFVASIVISGYQIIRLYTKEVGACLVYSALMCTYVPLIFYTYWVYGNVPAISLMIFSVWMVLALIKKERKCSKIIYGAGFVLSTIMACMYKSTCNIYLIALVLVAIVYTLRNKRAFLLCIVTATIIVSLAAPKLTQKFYEHKAGNVLGKGVPAVAYLAMGLQYVDEERIPGGWNGYHSNLFMDTGYNYEETSRISKESIKESLSGFRNDPSFAGHFFYNKILKQWANETHGVFWDVSNMGETDAKGDYWRNFIALHLYERWLSFIDVHESIIYLFIFFGVLGAILKKRKRIDYLRIEDILPLILFTGGFFFSIIWEGQTAAVLYYPVILLPFGISLTYKLVKKD